jgi:tRNA U34 5-methylaminomethyl-2-thiouridine-forming methyltransferase MnmC
MSDRIESETTLAHLHLIKTDDGSTTLKDQLLDESYRSECGAAIESFHVYLKNSGICDRLLRVHAPREENLALRILEYGFGTGLNYLLTASMAATHQKCIQYVGLEKLLLPATVLESLHLDQSAQQCTEFSSLSSPLEIKENWESLLDWRGTLAESPLPGSYSYVSEFVDLEIVVGQAQFLPAAKFAPFDAIYFDPFSPKSCPDLWNETVFKQAFHVLKPGGTLTTYCVAGAVRRALTTANFQVQRLPGPPAGKRQVLLAVRPDE